MNPVTSKLQPHLLYIFHRTRATMIDHFLGQEDVEPSLSASASETQGHMSIQAYLGRRLPHIFPSPPLLLPTLCPREPSVTARHKHPHLPLPTISLPRVAGHWRGILSIVLFTSFLFLFHHTSKYELHRQPHLRQGISVQKLHRQSRPQSSCSTLQQLQISPTHHQIFPLLPLFTTTSQQHLRPHILNHHGASFRR